MILKVPYTFPNPKFKHTVKTAEYRQKNAEIWGSSHLKCHRPMALSSANVSFCSINTILKCHKFYSVSSENGSCVQKISNIHKIMRLNIADIIYFPRTKL